MYRLLLDSKADLNIKDKQGVTPLIKAVQLGNSRMLQEIIKGTWYNVLLIMDTNNTPLGPNLIKNTEMFLKNRKFSCKKRVWVKN